MSYRIINGKLFKRTSTVEVVAPAFVFIREDDIEASAGYLLAGTLIVDIQKCDEMSDDDQKFITDILQQLSRRACSGRMPKNSVAYGWGGGAKPSNAMDTDNDALMLAWAEDRMCIAVRVDDRDHDGHLLIDDSIFDGVKAGRA
jgi:hypothetical protein